MTALHTQWTAPQLRLRGVTEPDLDPLSRLDREVFPEEPYPYFVLRQLFDVYRDGLLVLDDGIALKGYVLVGTSPDKSRSWILGLGIAKEERRRGHGRRLMLEVLRRLRGIGVGEVLLTVSPENTAAIQLYENLDFTAEKSVRKGYLGPGADRLVMRLRL